MAKRKRGRKRAVTGWRPHFKAHMDSGMFGCYTKRVKVRGGGTTMRGYCRKTMKAA